MRIVFGKVAGRFGFVKPNRIETGDVMNNSTDKLLARINSTSKLLTQEEFQELYGPTKGTQEVWRSTGRYNLPYIKVGSLIRYRESDIEEWLASRTVNKPNESPKPKRRGRPPKKAAL
jgi:predicted DNA-binding transcriptional regulator AlpA